MSLAGAIEPMRFVAQPPPNALTGAVRELWQIDDDGSFHAGLPKPWVELVVSLSGIHWWRNALAGREHRFIEGWVTPVQSGPRHARATGRRALIGARLEPWAARALFGPLPPGDGAPPVHLRRLIGAEARVLRARLLAGGSDAERFAIFGDWLCARPALAHARKIPLPRALRAGELAQALRVSPRTLRRRYAADVGLSPKRWLDLHRLDRLLRELRRDDAVSLADLALAHGFADQAHLSRTLERWTGATPGRLQRRGENLPPHLLPGG